MITEQEQQEITLLLATLQEVVDEAGADFVYRRLSSDMESIFTCLYVQDDKPDCIAAKVFAKLGVAVETLRRHEGNGADRVAMRLAADDPEFPLQTAASRAILRKAQKLQDHGWPWGECLLNARAYARTFGAQA